MGFLRGLLWPDMKKGQVTYQIVELEKPRELAQVDMEVRKSVASLALHPGFRYLLAKLRAQKQFLQGQLVTGDHATMQEVQRFQAGIYWAGWLETQLKTETALSEPRLTASPTQNEIDAFNAVKSQLEVVGQ
jgi:hypothetical protein